MESLVFAPPCPEYHPLEYPGELLWVPRDGRDLNEGVPCLLCQKDRAPGLILFFHANAEDLRGVAPFARALRDGLGLHVLAVEYPGYGICSGRSSEAAILDDAELVFAFCTEELEVPSSRILLMGRSMGGGPATYLAGQHDCAGLVTVSTFSSIRAAVSDLAGLWATFFVSDIFDNAARIQEARCPVLLVHGEADELVRPDHADALLESCQQGGVPAELELIEDMGHNGVPVKELVMRIQRAFQFTGLRASLPAAKYLARRATFVAPDVAERVPYGPEWQPPARHTGLSLPVASLQWSPPRRRRHSASSGDWPATPIRTKR